jgi:hypothetical protein
VATHSIMWWRRSLGSKSPLGFFVAPLVLFGLVAAVPFCSARISLTLHGHPFAHVVSKEKLDVFQYVTMDSFQNSAIVFSDDRAIGWIYSPMTFPRFVPFPAEPNDVDNKTFEAGLFDLALPLVSYFRWWWLVAMEAFVLLTWLQRRTKPIL